MGYLPQSPDPSRGCHVDLAVVQGRLLSLPREICGVSRKGQESSRGDLVAPQKSADGIVGRKTEGLNGEKDD